MIPYVSVEYLKIAGYVVSGIVAARAWFSKEIRVGKQVIAHYKQLLGIEVKDVEYAVKHDIEIAEAWARQEVVKAETEVKKIV